MAPTMTVSGTTGLCECPSQQYYYSVGTPTCRCNVWFIL